MRNHTECSHPAWQPTASPHLERCASCGTLRHKAFAATTGGRTVTTTRTVERQPARAA